MYFLFPVNHRSELSVDPQKITVDLGVHMVDLGYAAVLHGRLDTAVT